MQSNYRIRGGEVWTGIRKINETHFIGRHESIPFEPVNAFYPTIFRTFPAVLNQIAIGACEKLKRYNKTRQSVQKLKNVDTKWKGWCICSKPRPFGVDIKATLKGRFFNHL